MEHILLQALGDTIPDLIYLKDRFGHFIFVNSAFVKRIGATSPEEILGKTDFDVNQKELAQGYYDDDQAVVNSGQPLVNREELVVDSETGESRWHSTTKVPIHDDAGQIIGVAGITRDITISKQAESRILELNIELEQRVAERTTELQVISETLLNERNLMRTLIDSLPDNIFAKDTQSKFLLSNHASARGMGTTHQNLIGKDDFDFYPKDMAQRFFDDEQNIIQTGKPMLHREEPAVDNETGKIRWLLTSKFPVQNDAGNIVALVGIGRDITRRREAELALRESEERFRSLTELSSDWYWEQDVDLKFISLEDPNMKSGYQRNQVIGKTLKDLADTQDLAGLWLEHEAVVAARKPFRDLELRHPKADGQVLHMSWSGLPAFTIKGDFCGYRGIGRDITDRKLSEERIQYLATHDTLTSLPNRFMFGKILRLTIESARRNNLKFALLFIDLDHFKCINDTLGHDTGDFLLQEIAARFTQCLRSSDVVGRLGGDEFVILIPDVGNAEQIVTVAKKVLSAAVEPIFVRGQECRITASIGICLYPDDAQCETTLMKNADIAMYSAKEKGKNNYQFYSADNKVY